MEYRLVESDKGGLVLLNQYGSTCCPYQQDVVPCGTWCALFYIGSEIKTPVRSTSVTLCCSKVIRYLPLEVIDEKTT